MISGIRPLRQALAEHLATLRYRHAAVLLVLAGFGAALLYGGVMRDPKVHSGDTPSYLAAAYHLAHYDTFAETYSADDTGPSIGREPGYGFLLSLLMRVDPDGLGKATPDCVAVPDGCGPVYGIAQRVNVALFVLAAACVAITVALLPGSTPLAVLIGGLYVLFNGQTAKWASYLVSDALGIFLVALAGLLFAAALRVDRTVAWLPLGIVLGALVLTKAIFLGFLILAVPASLVFGLARRSRTVILGTMVVAVCSGAIIGGWVLRNAGVVGYPRLTDDRAGIVLRTREVLTHMTAQQYAASLVLWTRGIGDQIAPHLFAPEVLSPFRFETPGGFFDDGQNGYERRVVVLQAEGATRRDATRQIDRETVGAILAAPVAYAATMIPVFYRGIWSDEFILLGLPCLIWLTLRSLRRSNWAVLTILMAGWYNLTAHAAFTLNIPRYQVTAVPALAYATALALACLVSIWSNASPADHHPRR